MANAEYLTELVRAHYSGDDRRFSNLLNQVIAAESRAGHSRLAERLRELRIEGTAPTPRPRPPRLHEHRAILSKSCPSATAKRNSPTSYWLRRPAPRLSAM
jgi:hypothetical protein